MDKTDIRRVIDEAYDDSQELSLRSMLADFYGRRMRSTAILVWAWGLIFMAGAVFSAVMFFRADQTRDQILYAALFVCFLQLLGLMKIFAWQMLQRHGASREIKRLEIRIDEMAKSLDKTARTGSH